MTTPLSEPTCDWYQATVELGHESLVEYLCTALGATARPLKKGINGYTTGVELIDLTTAPEQRRAIVAYGGHNPLPNVLASSSEAPALLRALRSLEVIRHRVTRVDSALDYDEPGVFDRLTSLALSIADAPRQGGRIKVGYMGDWARGEARTLTLGARGGRAYMRIYEKGFEQRDRNVADASLDWVRVELEYRPDRVPEKLRAAGLSMSEVWGASGWSRDMWAALHEGEFAGEVIQDRPEPSTRASALAAMARQYGPTVRGLIEDLGAVGALAELERIWGVNLHG